MVSTGTRFLSFGARLLGQNLSYSLDQHKEIERESLSSGSAGYGRTVKKVKLQPCATVYWLVSLYSIFILGRPFLPALFEHVTD